MHRSLIKRQVQNHGFLSITEDYVMKLAVVAADELPASAFKEIWLDHMISGDGEQLRAGMMAMHKIVRAMDRALTEAEETFEREWLQKADNVVTMAPRTQSDEEPLRLGT